MKWPGLFRIRSFRMRIALLSVLVSGSALVALGELTMAALHHLALERMDTSIREFAHKHLKSPVGPRRWEGLEQALQYFLQSDLEKEFILLVTSRDGSLLHLSPNWPTDLPLEEFTRDASWGVFSGPAPTPIESTGAAIPSGRESTASQTPNRRSESAQEKDANITYPLKVPRFTTREDAGEVWRIGMMGNPETTIVLGLNMERLSRETAQTRRAYFTVLPFALVMVALGAWWLSERALQPVTAVTRTIQKVKAQGLDQRVATRDEDVEFSDLIVVFNDMMDWLERSFRQASRFTADASHELRTPLTILQVQLEQAVLEAPGGSMEQRRYVTLGLEVQRLKSITEKLLLLSRIDAGELVLVLHPLDMSELLEGVVEDTTTLAPELSITADIESDCWVRADSELLQQVLQNLAANAMTYNRKDGFIRFALWSDREKIGFRIENSGPVIPSDDFDKIFTRFHRVDHSRSRNQSGSGLGLSLAREIARAHHGELELAGSEDECTTFVLTLPRAPITGAYDTRSAGTL